MSDKYSSMYIPFQAFLDKKKWERTLGNEFSRAIPSINPTQ